MSLAVKDALLATKDLGKNERAVAIAIAAHANHEGNAWPSVATIANYAGIDTNVRSATFGQVLSFRASRSAQLTFRFRF